jgi:adenylosuccinate synthase
MSHTAIIGPQWGDEGKGKLVDVQAPQHDYIVRFNGGANAGHTVITPEGQKFVFHLMPSGAAHGKKSVIANGVLVNFDRLKEEVDDLAQKGIVLTNKDLFVSDRAQIVTPYHILMDIAEEIYRKRRGEQVGTTMQGIGPTSETEAGRNGIRTANLFFENQNELEARLRHLWEDMDCKLRAMDISEQDVTKSINENENKIKMSRGFRPYHNEHFYVDPKKILEEMLKHRDRFKDFVTDTSVLLHEADKTGRQIMFEGAQATFLDPGAGTYPRCTTTRTIMGAIHTGTLTYIIPEHRIGVLKAYTTRVGEGAFPTKLKDETGKRIAERGKEFGATTGRARDCGWLDMVMAKAAVRINGFNEFAITKLDVLDQEEVIKVCMGYNIRGAECNNVPPLEQDLFDAKPKYKELAGWKQDTSKARTFDDLPPQAQAFVLEVEKDLGVPVKYISIGEKRDQIITR